jgi:Tol biopolymer transport system component
MKPTKHLLSIALLCAALSAGYLAGQATSDKAEVALQAAIKMETVDGDLKGAIEQYKKIAALPGAARSTVATALLRMGRCYEKLGDADTQEARKAYERVVREYADQTALAAEARTKLAALGTGPSPAPGVTVRQVWASAPWYGAQGEPSRDGAYLSFRTAGEDLAIRDLATGQIRQLTKHQIGRQSAWNSVPSPDGKQIAYLWREAGAWELRVVGHDGAEPRVLCRKADTDAVRPFPSDWSPDGTSILAVLWHFLDPGSGIALVSVRDGSMRILKDFDKRLTERPRFSPDGRFIVFDRQQRPGSKESDIFVLALDGGREIPLVEHPANDVSPDWTPDGEGILFFSDRTGTMGAWWIPVAEGSPRGTPELLKPDVRPGMGFTRNGSYYYSVRTELVDVYIAEVDLATGKLISAPRAATQRFVGFNGGPDWSPDGRQLLFVSKRGSGASEDRWGPCICSSESGEVRELVSKFDRIRHVRWAPDGRSYLAQAGFSSFRIDVQTGDFVPISLHPEVMWLPALSRDGKTVFYQAVFRNPKRYCVLARDLETGEDRELYRAVDPAHFSSWLTLSPDGRHLAFVFNEGAGNGSKSLKVMPTAGGETRDVLRGLQMPFCEAPIAWAPDSASLIFIKQLDPTPDSKTELWSISIEGGEPRRLELAVEGMISISIHPDGRRIAFTQARNCDEVWALENFLPPAKTAK